MDAEWHALLDVALDAMKAGRKAEAEAMFAELDGMHEGWQFEVPYRNRRPRQMICGLVYKMSDGRTRRIKHHTTLEQRALQIVMTMLYIAQYTPTKHRFVLHGVSDAQLALMFGVTRAALRQAVRIGIEDLGISDPDSAEAGTLIAIEDDFDPEERLRALRDRIRKAGQR